jgi:hypothetical protein
MIEAKTYSFGELMEALSKEGNLSKPKLGDKVTSDNEKNNGKAVSDIMKETSKYNDLGKSEKRKTNPELEKDWNKTTLDLHYDVEPSDDYKERVKSQVKGFPSVDNEKNTKIKEDDSADFSGNEDFLNQQEEKTKDVTKRKAEIEHSGLNSHNLPKDIFKDKTVFEEKKTMKQLNFSKTKFLTEADIIKHVPEEYKVDGNRFYMKDAQGNQSLVECVKDKCLDYVHVNVVRTVNKASLQEEYNRMKELTNYSPNQYMKGSINENRETSNKDFMHYMKEFGNHEKESESQKKFKKLCEDMIKGDTLSE